MDLSIIIVNWNTRDLLAQCVQSVHDTVQGLEFEVFVVDNASSDGSADMVRQRFPDVRLIENAENVGFARANNQAIRESTGEFVLLLNSDAILLPEAALSLVACMQSHKAAGAVGAKTLNPTGTLQDCYGVFPSVWSEVFTLAVWHKLTKPWGVVGSMSGSKLHGDEPFVVDRVSASCVMVRRETIIQVGLLDERFFLFSEEYDWFLRMKKQGWQTLLCPRASAIHYWGGSTRRAGVAASVLLYASKRLYFAKHYGAVADNVLRTGLAFRFAIKLLVDFLRVFVGRTQAREDAALHFHLIKTMLLPLQHVYELGRTYA